MSDCGYFAPESAIWRIGRESVLMLGGGRALLAQAAHPLVAVGVVEHSDYADQPWRRLGRTMTALYTIVFGTKAEADRAGAVVQAVHERVHGGLRVASGRFPAGTRYSAADPELMLWVHATLVETALTMYRTFVGRVEADVEARFYDEMKLVARVFGVPGPVLPARVGDFWEYWDAQLKGVELAVTADAQRVAAVVVDPPLPRALRPLRPAAELATIGLLPRELRERYGLRLDPARRAALAATKPLVRRALLPLAPSRVRLLVRASTDGTQRQLPLRLLAAVAGR